MQCWARSSARPAPPTPKAAGGAGSSTRSTAPRATPGGSRCGRRSSRSRSTASWWPAWCRRRRWARGGRRRAVPARSATANRSPVSKVARIEDAHLAYDSVDAFESVGFEAEFLALARRCWRVRGFGDFWAHMLVADGSIDIAVEVGGLAVWDLAAVKVVVDEAGGRCTDLRGDVAHRRVVTSSRRTACSTTTSWRRSRATEHDGGSARGHRGHGRHRHRHVVGQGGRGRRRRQRGGAARVFRTPCSCRRPSASSTMRPPRGATARAARWPSSVTSTCAA